MSDQSDRPTAGGPANVAAAIMQLHQEEAPVIAMIGTALRAFAEVEFGLASIYYALMHPLPLEVAVVQYNEITALNYKVKIVREVGTLRLSMANRKELVALTKGIDPVAKTRGLIAHSRPRHWHPTGRVTPENRAEAEMRLVPILPLATREKRIANSIGIEGMMAFTEECLCLSKQLYEFADRLEKAAPRMAVDALVFPI